MYKIWRIVMTDRYVMLGNHRDSWVVGSVDPHSGTASMMELSRAMSEMVKQGTSYINDDDDDNNNNHKNDDDDNK